MLGEMLLMSREENVIPVGTMSFISNLHLTNSCFRQLQIKKGETSIQG